MRLTRVAADQAIAARFREWFRCCRRFWQKGTLQTRLAAEPNRAAAVVGLAATLLTGHWMPDYRVTGAFLGFGLIGASFCRAYFFNRERLWWMIIPGLGTFTLLAAVLSDYFIGKDPEILIIDDWINVLVIGIGAAVIGAVLEREDAKLVLYIVAMFAFLVGFAMAPFTTLLKGILMISDILIAGFFFWRNRNNPVRSS